MYATVVCLPQHTRASKIRNAIRCIESFCAWCLIFLRFLGLLQDPVRDLRNLPLHDPIDGPQPPCTSTAAACRKTRQCVPSQPQPTPTTVERTCVRSVGLVPTKSSRTAKTSLLRAFPAFMISWNCWRSAGLRASVLSTAKSYWGSVCPGD